MFSEILGAWVAGFLTIAILSYLYEDNPFYKFAEHVYVGVSAAYWGTIAFWNQVYPNLFGRLWPQVRDDVYLNFANAAWYKIYSIFSFLSGNIFPKGGIPTEHHQNFWYIIPFILGIFMLLRLVPSVGWLARWSLAYVVGLAAGLRMYGFMNSNILRQIHGTVNQVVTINGWFDVFNFAVLFVGLLSALFYFFFSKEHTGIFGGISRVGIYFLMISFGASFGFAVMGRISLLIGRFNDLIIYAKPDRGYATIVILGIVVFTLAALKLREKRKTPVTE